MVECMVYMVTSCPCQMYALDLSEQALRMLTSSSLSNYVPDERAAS